MANKARNIYIDTTGFCEDAQKRVHDALYLLSNKDDRLSYALPKNKVVGIDFSGSRMGRENTRQMDCSDYMDHPRQVWLFELESLAGIR